MDLRKHYLAKKLLDSVHLETPERENKAKRAKTTTRVFATSTNFYCWLKNSCPQT